MAKSVTGGKKGKKKSKKPKVVKVCAFDLDSISLPDLKIYVTKLEKEHALMRKERAFYIANKDKIMDFLMAVRNAYDARKETSIVKNSQIDNLIEQLGRFPATYFEKALINDKENHRRKLKKMFHEFLEKNVAKSEHLEEEFDLELQISDMDKQLKQNQHLYESSVMDTKELFGKAQQEIDNKYSNLLENTLKHYVKESLTFYNDFNADRIKLLFSIWNGKGQEGDIKESVLNEIKDMQNFFSEISCNNKEVMKMLKDKLDFLSIEEKKLKISLKELTLQNVKFQNIEQPAFYYNNCVKAPIEEPNNIKDKKVEKKFEKLQFKNEVLKAHLENITGNWEVLKRQFMNATRKLYQAADLEAFILEEIIKKKLLMDSVASEDEESEDITVRKQMDEKNDVVDDGINVLSMTIEDSDTLYVPPVYHEFWDSTFKQFRRKTF